MALSIVAYMVGRRFRRCRSSIDVWWRAKSGEPMIRVEALTKNLQGEQGRRSRPVAGINFEVAGRARWWTLLGPSGLWQDHHHAALRPRVSSERTGGRISIGDPRRWSIAEAKVVRCRRISAISAWCSSPTPSGPHMTVLENVAYALEGKRFFQGRAATARHGGHSAP